MSTQKIAINRGLVGLLALGCLAAAASMLLFGPSEHDTKLWMNGFFRVGLVMAAFWLAMPSRHRDAAWANVSPMMLVGLLLAVFAVARSPKAVLPVLALVAVAGFFLRPRGKKRPKARPPG